MKNFSKVVNYFSSVGMCSILGCSLLLSSLSLAQPNRSDVQDRNHPRYDKPPQHQQRGDVDNRGRDQAVSSRNREQVTQRDIERERRLQQQRAEERYKENQRHNQPSFDHNQRTFSHDPRTVEHPRHQPNYKPQPLPKNFNSLRNDIRKNNHYYSRGPSIPRHVKVVKGNRFPAGYGRVLPYEQARYLPHYQGYEWRSVGRDLVLVAVSTGIIYTILDNVLN